jgi:hypothetical protein
MKKLLKIVWVSFSFLLVAFIAFCVWSVYDVNAHKAQDDQKTQWVNRNYQRYYDAQKTYYDKLSKALSVPADKLNINADVNMAKKTMTLCINQLDAQHCENVIQGTLWIGEPKFWVEMTIGNYTRSQNTTTVNGLVREQWIYGNPLSGATYVYFDNDKLSAYQNTEQ